MGKGENSNSSTTTSNNMKSSPTESTSPAVIVDPSTQSPNKTFYTWSEIEKHNKKGDTWIVIQDDVYNVSTFIRRHPGGSKVLSLYAGQDATEVFLAFHKEPTRTEKYLKALHIGKLAPHDVSVQDELTPEKKKKLDDSITRQLAIRNDFVALRKTAEDLDLFKPNILFYFLHAFHILFFHVMGYYIMIQYGGGLIPFCAALICHILAQGQTNWTQHDYGHQSVFKNGKFNRVMHLFWLGLIKGACAEWWNHLHNQHHAKPNVINKDPDTRIDPVFVVGKVQPKRRAQKDVDRSKKMPNSKPFPYTQQHKYFFIAAPMLFPFYFQYTTIKYAIERRKYADLICLIIMYSLHFLITIPTLGLTKSIGYWLVWRLTESAWFTWVSQCNHIVMDVHDDNGYDSWLDLQLRATCNIDPSFFNDWFTGHLNFQIEHHLFPTMPRHNYCKIQPYVKLLCKKYDIKYVSKGLLEAFTDIITSLQKSGDLWKEAYEEIQNGCERSKIE